MWEDTIPGHRAGCRWGRRHMRLMSRGVPSSHEGRRQLPRERSGDDSPGE